MGIWVDTTIHAREWVATSTGVNLMDRVSQVQKALDVVSMLLQCRNSVTDVGPTLQQQLHKRGIYVFISQFLTNGLI